MPADAPVLQRTYAVAAAASEEFTAWLWRAGSLGSHQESAAEPGEIHQAYFAAGAQAPPVPPGVALVAETTVGPADWMATWRARAEPLAIGRRLLVDPREPAGAEAPASRRAPDPRRILLRIPARSAFGTGGHESTRLVLELLERLPLAGARVLDVGTGAGLLTLAALALGAASAVGFDVDPVAPILARQNALLNGADRSLAPYGAATLAAGATFFAGTAAALGGCARYDVLLVNVIPSEIEGDLPRLGQLLRPGGDAVFSGILASEGRSSLRRLRAQGFIRIRSRRAAEWVAYHCRRA